MLCNNFFVKTFGAGGAEPIISAPLKNGFI
jgi:hypothetical protein